MDTKVPFILSIISLILAIIALVMNAVNIVSKQIDVVCSYPVEHEVIPDIHVYEDVKAVYDEDEDYYIVVTRDNENIIAPKGYCERVDR